MLYGDWFVVTRTQVSTNANTMGVICTFLTPKVLER